MRRYIIIIIMLTSSFNFCQIRFDTFKLEFIKNKSSTLNESVDNYYSNIMNILMYSKKDTLKFGFINKDGKVIIEPGYDFATDFNNNISNVIKNGVSGVLFKNGETHFFQEYSSTFFYDSKLGLAYDNLGKAGYINLEGDIIIPFIYEEVNPFIGGYASVRKNNKWFYINDKGEKVLSDSLIYNYKPIIKSKAVFMDNKKIEISKNRLGNLFCQMIEFLDKEQKFSFKEGLIDVNGKVIVQSNYDEISGYFH